MTYTEKERVQGMINTIVYGIEVISHSIKTARRTNDEELLSVSIEHLKEAEKTLQEYRDKYRTLSQ